QLLRGTLALLVRDAKLRETFHGRNESAIWDTLPPMTAPGWSSWSFDPLLWVVLVAAGSWYVMMLRRVRRVTGKPVGPGHWLFYWSRLAMLLIALGSPLDAL